MLVVRGADHHRLDRRPDRRAVRLHRRSHRLILTRFVDVMYAFPRLLFNLVMSMLGPGDEYLHQLGLTG
jgi:hypothetical protein